MYFFSGENTCLKVMPASPDISVKCRSLAYVEEYQGQLVCSFDKSSTGVVRPRAFNEKDPSWANTTIAAISLIVHNPTVLLVITGCRISTPKLFGDIDLALPFSLASSGRIGLTQLVVHLGSLRLQL